MANSFNQEITSKLDQYLRGVETLESLEEWLVSMGWDVSPLGDRTAHELVTAILLRIAEFTNGDWTESELRERLTALIEQSTITFSGSDDPLIRYPGPPQGSFSVVGTAHSGVHA